MSDVPFHYVDLRTFSYATEDDETVERALRTFLPEDAEVTRAPSEGHHGDPILVLSARVENADGIRTVLARLAELPAADLAAVREELADRVDEDCSFFLTFDKQAAAGGEVARGDGITLRAKVEAYPAKRESAIENARGALEAL